MEIKAPKKFNLFGVYVSRVDYKTATEFIIRSANNNKSISVTALAVHGLMEGVRDKNFGRKLNEIDLVAPDGHPVRWSLNYFYGADLKDRTYGPNLMLHVCEKACKQNLKIFLYGSTMETIKELEKNLKKKIPELMVAGKIPSRFRQNTDQEEISDMQKIKDSGAGIVFVGTGCPRQENYVFEHRDKLPVAWIAVGAAFDFHAKTKRQAPAVMQKAGLEWLFRLCTEPRRLWKRYLTTNLYFIYLFFKKMVFKGNGETQINKKDNIPRV